MSTCWPAPTAARRSVVFASHEETLVEQAKLLRFGECCQIVEYWKQRADAAGCDDEARRRHEVRATVASTFDAMVDLRAVLDPLGGAMVVAELNRLMEHQRRQDKRDGTVRTAGQRRARHALRQDDGHPVAYRPPTDRPGCCRCPGGAPSPAPSGGRSKYGTGTANTPPDATNQPTAATSTTSSPTPTAAQPPSTTGGSAAGPTTATTTSATPTHRPSPMRMPASADHPDDNDEFTARTKSFPHMSTATTDDPSNVHKEQRQ